MNQLDIKKFRIVCAAIMGTLPLCLIGLSFFINEHNEQYKIDSPHSIHLAIVLTGASLFLAFFLSKKEAQRQKQLGLIENVSPERLDESVSGVVGLQIALLSVIGLFGCVLSYFTQSWSYAIIMGSISTAALAFVFPTVEKIKFLYSLK